MCDLFLKQVPQYPGLSAMMVTTAISVKKIIAVMTP